LNISSSKI